MIDVLLYAFLDLKINDYILLNFILFIYLLFLTGPQGQQCYTLMGFSILYKNSLLLLLLLIDFCDVEMKSRHYLKFS